jgi:hypothetical protein
VWLRIEIDSFNGNHRAAEVYYFAIWFRKPANRTGRKKKGVERVINQQIKKESNQGGSSND